MSMYVGPTCYMLCSRRRRSYIGCAWVPPAPWRRLRQHNGLESGGVERLVSGRPWEVLCFVYGFTNHIMALQFEAAWQRGFAAACMRHVPRFTPSPGPAGKVELLRALLHTPAWCDLRLSVHLVDGTLNAPTLTVALSGYRLLSRGPNH